MDQVFGSENQQVKSSDHFKSFEFTTFYGNFIFAHKHIVNIKVDSLQN